MKVEGIYQCGHTGIAIVTGNKKTIDWKIENAFNDRCPECRAKLKEEEIKRATEYAQRKTEEYELIALNGSEKQVKWANQFRIYYIDNFVEKINELREHYSMYHTLVTIKKEKGMKEEQFFNYVQSVCVYLIDSKLDSVFWINNGYITETRTLDLFERYYKEYDNAIDTKKPIEHDIILENTIKPEYTQHSGIVEIMGDDTLIEVKYEKNSVFLNIMKGLKFIFDWNDFSWKRKLNEHTGSFKDRASELTNTLLLNGFKVSVANKEVKENAIKGEFERECTRWIKIKKSKLSIEWQGKDDKLYQSTKRIVSAHWDYESKSILVDLSHYEEILDFAENESFKIDTKAKQTIDAYRVEESNIYTVVPKESENKDNSKENILKNILISPNTILEDLRDE